MPIRSRTIETRQHDCVSILQVSDLHFASAESARTGGTVWLRSFEALLKGRPELAPDFIAVTGDLLDNGSMIRSQHAKTLQAAKQYLHDLCDMCGIIATERLIVIPGNHDYKWMGLLGSKRSRLHFDTALKEYANDLYVEYGEDQGMLLACFDSNVVRYSGELAMGCVDRTQMSERETTLTNVGAGRRVVKIALVHHHPLPVATSESLTPEGVEKWLSRKMVGAPEFMIFRNAGTFLEKLLSMRFRAVLHGHLHHRGYLRVAQDVNGRPQSLEVFSCASLGSPPPGRPHSFHLLQVQYDGVLRSLTYEFNAEGVVEGPLVTPTLRYEDIRPACWDDCSPHTVAAHPLPRSGGVVAGSATGNDIKPTTAVVCELHEKTWEVHLPRGDFTSTDVITGLRSRSGPVESVPLLLSPGALTAHEVKAYVPGSPGRVTAEVDRVTDGDTFRCWLRFNPPLTPDPVTVLVILHAEGVVIPSQEEQELIGLSDERLGWESCTQTISFPTHRLKMSLRFDPPERTPASMHYTVLGPQVQRMSKPERESARKAAQSETALTRGGFHDWRPTLVPWEEKQAFLPRPQATCFVDAPLLGYRYRLWWPVPPQSDIPKRDRLMYIRSQLLSVKNDPQRSPLAGEFLRGCLEAARSVIRNESPGANADDQFLHGCLFGLATEPGRPGPGRLRSVASTSDQCALHAKELVWGRDIIGQAFRRGTLVTFANAKLLPVSIVHQLTDLPSDIRFLLAYPLYCYEVDGYPAAVLGLASTSDNSGLGVLVRPPAAQNQGSAGVTTVAAAAAQPAGALATEIYSLWNDVFPSLLAVTPP